MTQSIKKPVTKSKVLKAIDLLQKKSEAEKPSLRMSFGVLKRGIEPVDYQNTIRNEWD